MLMHAFSCGTNSMGFAQISVHSLSHNATAKVPFDASVEDLQLGLQCLFHLLFSVASPFPYGSCLCWTSAVTDHILDDAHLQINITLVRQAEETQLPGG